MREFCQKITGNGRLLATLLLVGTLVLGSAAGVDFLRGYFADQATASLSGPSIAQAPDETGSDSGEGMVPSGSSKAEPSGCCLIPLVLKSDNSSSRWRTEGRPEAESDLTIRPLAQTRPVSTSSSRIDSRLGHQFTLVGAHPSGTS
jgi:hypothetical protein